MIPKTGRNNRCPWWLPWLFTLSFILITFLPRSMDDTMFMDGVTYAAIARNMSEGIGSFWRPFFAHSFWLPYDNGDYFSGQPPLQFGLQSILFSLFGDTPAVENGYNMLILTGYIFLIVRMWNTLPGPVGAFRSFAWLPILCWYGMVVVYYSIPNNFLDSTMGLFCLAACYFQLEYLKEGNVQKRNIMWPLSAGICIVLAFLTKGPVGLYPLAFASIFAFSSHSLRLRDALRPTIIMLAVVVASVAGMLAYTPAREFMATYWNGQVVQALLQKREKAGNEWTAHFTLLGELLRNITPHLIAWVVLYGLSIGLHWKVFREKAVAESVMLTALVAASSIVPILVSIKQYPHYLLPASPFVALLFALLLVQRMAFLMESKEQLAIIALSIGALACWGATISKLTTMEPDVHASNAKKLRTLVPSATTLGICHELFQQADVHANFQRYHHLSLSTQTDSMRYVLADSACLPQFDFKKDSLIQLNGGYYLVIQNP
ncbi:MAG: hypothetical protein BGO21_24470 [Dyadobacter sp. 50-39]|uniref:ArnT family glycosyltransferase n=1 Tax=Dyadobacter sp. 50-39 TaxID=1895756 RepID=UPI000962871F|nr:glycosyltransferase family 39 protein [Dyadobacter sp. 50-39]OJV18678.1 MAG: hypothetical protein BGO21_24470 [Dyadobacter sp. 50-39]